MTATLCASAPALAQDAGKGAEPKKDKVICKREKDFATGSHLPAPRTCMKESEWKELDQHTERLLRDANNGRESPITSATGPSTQPQ